MKLLSFAHFLVDLTCAFLVAHSTDTNLVIALIVYNFCAFALQMPLGIIVESSFNYKYTAACGLILIVLSWLFRENLVLCLSIAGIGNALFHIGGGIHVMSETKKMTPLGIFIAPGALGIFVGALLPIEWANLLISLLILVAFALVKSAKGKEYKRQDVREQIEFSFPLICLFLVVMIRGFIGIIDVFTWKVEYLFLFVLAGVLGKICGGILADIYGGYRVCLVSLVVSCVCFLLPEQIVCGLIGVFCFQMTMPITLHAIGRMCAKGFGFGLLTFGLFFGGIPLYLNWQVKFELPLLVLGTILLFVYGVKKENLE